MGDSDDEYGGRRERSKFRNEREQPQRFPDERRDNNWGDNRGGWNNRPSGGRDERYGGRDSFGRSRERYGSPSRREMSPPSKRMRGRDYDDRGFGDYDRRSRDSGRESLPSTTASENCPTQPILLSFKQFIDRTEDDIGAAQATTKYNEYKAEFKKKQAKEFFDKHKDEEWFRVKFHPDEMPQYLQEKADQVHKRLEVFKELWEKGWFNVSLDEGNTDAIIRILDAAVIKLEGGSDDDLAVLDTKPEEKAKDTKSEGDVDSLFSVDSDATATAPSVVSKPATEPKLEDGEENPKESAEKGEGVNGAGIKEFVEEDSQDTSEKKENGSEEQKTESSTVKSGLEETTGPLLLHKTTSVFFRNLPPNITREEVNAVCEQIPGFLRLCLAEPQIERKFFRRGWATFRNNVPIKKIIFGMTQLCFHNANCGAIQNRDLTRRIRWANGLASHMDTIRADLRNAAKIIYNLDKQKGLWVSDKSETDQQSDLPITTTFAHDSKNPLLQDITDYLVEEGNAEEEELLGMEVGELDPEEENSAAATFQRDEQVIRIFDRMIYYLRIVHSLDYYQATEYPMEDKMPNRIGIMHCRGPTPTSKVTKKEIQEYIKSFEVKLAPFLEAPAVITEEEAEQLGVTTEEVAENEYVKSLIKSSKTDRFECALEGKKFKGPEFVEKHIRTKHPHELEEVRKNAVYYKNYILDPKRPQLPEHPSNRLQAQSSSKDARSPSERPSIPATPPYLPLPQMPYPGQVGYVNYRGYGGGPRPQIPFDGMGPRMGTHHPRPWYSRRDYRDIDKPDTDEYF